MKKPFITDIILLASLVMLVLSFLKISSLENKQSVMKKEITHKDSLIQSLNNEIELFDDILQEREMEVKYWGMKYDSLKQPGK